MIAAIEAGGTKILCALARADGTVLEQVRITTAAPAPTFAAIAAFYDAQARVYGAVAGCGVASFGPLDLDRTSPHHGCLTGTPKPGWAGIDMAGRIAEIVRAPVAIDTDVNCAALAELRRGAAIGLDRACYVTVGTGIGVGIVDRGEFAGGGAGHAEAGHIGVARAPGDTAFAGICPYHGDCLEGLASGPAMHARWGIAAEHLPGDHPGWIMAAHYIASLCVTLSYTVRPQRIVLGGGVLERDGLYDRIRNGFVRITAGYALDRWSADPATFLCAPVLRDPSPGLVGAIELARDVMAKPLASDVPRDRGDHSPQQ